MKGYCPECDTLQEITPTGQKKHEGWSAEWWRVVLHKHPAYRLLCAGSGKKV